MFTRTIFITIFLSVILLATRPIFADPSATIVVNSSLDGVGTNGGCTLREAIINANNDDQSGSIDCAAGAGADVITFHANLGSPTISLFNGEYTITDELTINGVGQTNMTINGRDVTRIFHVDNSSLTLTDMTLRNGNLTVSGPTGLGGCLYAESFLNGDYYLILENVTVKDCVVEATGSGALGGGVATQARNLQLTNVTFDNNLADSLGGGSAFGGALYSTSQVVTFNNVTATNNRAQAEINVTYGGALFHSGATMWNWTGGNVTGNSAESAQSSAHGGGIYVNSDGSADWNDVMLHQNNVVVNVTGSVQGSGGGLRFSGNLTATDLVATENVVTSNAVETNTFIRGGGLDLISGDFNLIDSQVQENRLDDPDSHPTLSYGSGGGIYASLSSSLTLTNTQVYSNSAKSGGGIELDVTSCSGGPSSLTGGDVQFNVATRLGGGVMIRDFSPLDGCHATLSGTTVRNNQSASLGGGVFIQGDIVTIDNTTITSNESVSGGGGGLAFSASGLSATIRNTTIAQNDAVSGGGMSIGATSIITVEATTSITNNTADGHGGGILNDGQLVVLGATVSGNSGDSGGGINNDGNGQLTLLSGTTINANNATQGGGIYNDGQLAITDATINGNVVTGRGGGIRLNQQGATLNRVALDNNKAGTEGGGISTGRPFTITQSTLSNNFATTGGGIYYSAATNGQLANSTLSKNSASGQGSGIYLFHGFNTPDLTLTNVTIADGTGAGAIVNDQGMMNQGTLNLFNSIVANNAGEQCGGTITVGSAPNLATDGTCSATVVVVDAGLESLQDNGGSTETHALRTGSAAIDAGRNSICNGSPVNGVDQRGLVRPTGASCDLGAYEVGEVVPTAVSLSGASADPTPNLLVLTLLLSLMTIIGVDVPLFQKMACLGKVSK